MLAGEVGRETEPVGGHCQWRTTNGQQVVELISDVIGRPPQCSEKNIANLLEGQVDDSRLDVTREVCRAYRSRCLDLGLAVAV